MTDALLEGLGRQRKDRRHRHRWDTCDCRWTSAEVERDCCCHGGVACRPGQFCLCGAVKDPARSRAGKNARNRGNAYERSIATRLGLKRVGQYGSEVDVGSVHDWAVIQCKVGGAFPERIWRWLNALPRGASHIRAVVIGDAPGSAKKRREVIVMDLDEFEKWYGR